MTKRLGPKPGEDEPTRLATRVVAEQTYLKVLDECLQVMAASGVKYGFMGGLASTVHGRERHTHDIDILVRKRDAGTVLEHFDRAGFKTEKTNPDWLFKAAKGGLLVDVIFASTDGTTLDDETRVRVREFHGRRVPVVGPEDLLLLKLPAFNEATPRHWFDCLEIVKSAELDWKFVAERGQGKPHRLLSLLEFARAEGARVPETALTTLRRAAKTPKP